MATPDRLLGIHAAALTVRQRRLEMLASNIANASTPNFKARDLDFGTALDAAVRNSDMSSAVKYRVPAFASADGNTVEMATEQTAFAENAVQFRTSLAFLQGRIATLSRALKGE